MEALSCFTLSEVKLILIGLSLRDIGFLLERSIAGVALIYDGIISLT